MRAELDKKDSVSPASVSCSNEWIKNNAERSDLFFRRLFRERIVETRTKPHAGIELEWAGAPILEKCVGPRKLNGAADRDSGQKSVSPTERHISIQGGLLCEDEQCWHRIDRDYPNARQYSRAQVQPGLLGMRTG